MLLRPLELGDLDDLYAIQSRPDVTRYLPWPPRSREEVHELLAARAGRTTLRCEGDTLRLAMVLHESGPVIGEVSLTHRSDEHSFAEIGFVLHPDAHGKGLAVEAATEMLRLGFDEFGLHRIVGRCDERNVASAKVMEKLGMRREAHLIMNEVINGEWTSEFDYAMLASEWADRHQVGRH